MAYKRDLRLWPRVHATGGSSTVPRDVIHVTCFHRCPFNQLAGALDPAICPGYEAELIPVRTEATEPTEAVCAHLVSAPHPGRDAMVGVCDHPEAERIVAEATRLLRGVDVTASAASVIVEGLRGRALAAQLRSAHLVGRTHFNCMWAGAEVDRHRAIAA